jgi:hypothetical protein
MAQWHTLIAVRLEDIQCQLTVLDACLLEVIDTRLEVSTEEYSWRKIKILDCRGRYWILPRGL